MNKKEGSMSEDSKGYSVDMDKFLSFISYVQNLEETNETWLNLEGAATHLNVSKDTLRSWIKEKDKNNFPAYRVGKLWRFKMAELDKWVKNDGK